MAGKKKSAKLKIHKARNQLLAEEVALSGRNRQ